MGSDWSRICYWTEGSSSGSRFATGSKKTLLDLKLSCEKSHDWFYNEASMGSDDVYLRGFSSLFLWGQTKCSPKISLFHLLFVMQCASFRKKISSWVLILKRLTLLAPESGTGTAERSKDLRSVPETLFTHKYSNSKTRKKKILLWKMSHLIFSSPLFFSACSGLQFEIFAAFFLLHFDSFLPPGGGAAGCTMVTSVL